MIECYFILFIITDYFNRRPLYYLLIVFPLSAFLGHWTGFFAVDTGSSPFLELILITVPFILPYIHYRLIFTKEKFNEYIEEYSNYLELQEPNNKKINQVKKDLSEFKKIYSDYIKSNQELKYFEKRLYLKTLNTNLKKTFKTQKYPHFKNKKYTQLKNKLILRNKIIESFTEFISLISGGIIAGCSEESIVKAIGHFNDYLYNTNKKHFLKHYYLEYTKAKTDIIRYTKNNYFLIFYLKYWSKSMDSRNYFNNYKHYLILENSAWNQRKKYVSFVDTINKKMKRELYSSNQLEKEIFEKKSKQDRTSCKKQ